MEGLQILISQVTISTICYQTVTVRRAAPWAISAGDAPADGAAADAGRLRRMRVFFPVTCAEN
jgi:hypothetical protein